ncbi:Glucokinase [hydrothermal vent metagenome]|uniref:Glucokinase n=1 Tax=hydrothermal vent metagenome TaxID=652676 RepID=A0A3B0S3M1_9ZZZZ
MSDNNPILVADIGGTNARFAIAIADEGPAGFALHHQQTLLSKDFDSLPVAINAYCETLLVPIPQQACFALAAQPGKTVFTFTNSPWQLDSRQVKQELGLQNMRVVNDFEAMASGAQFVAQQQRLYLCEGAGDVTAPQLVLGPGTGLGLGLIVPGDNGYRIISTEGGHATFAPETKEEIEILRLMMRKETPVLFEHLLSGPGLVNIYQALCVLADKPCMSLRPEQITAAANNATCANAKNAVQMFCDILGSFAGNAAVTTGARGGVFLAGGILPKMTDILLQSQFLARFCSKGPQQNYLADVPVCLLLSENTALIGAAHLMRDELR